MIKLKLIVAGEKDVGKTSLIHRYINNTFETDTVSTIGVDFMVKRLMLNETPIQLSIWDFAGEKKFRTLFPSYVTGSSGALILFDISNRDSFLNLPDWMELINSSSGQMVKLLIISKIDLIDQGAVSEEEVAQFVQNNHIDAVLKCSAKTGENVDKVFETISKMIVEQTLQQCPNCQEMIAKDLHFCSFCGYKL